MAVGHYENFPVASLLLPAPLREPVEVIYRFARSADDFADEGDDPPEVRLQKLNDYRAQLDRAVGRRCSTTWRKSFGNMALPLQLFADLLDAFSQDVTRKRYATSPRCSTTAGARPIRSAGCCCTCSNERLTQSCAQSDAICSALQLINFWQDVDVDYAKDDRVYLPQDEMARFGVTERICAEKRCDAAWQALMEFQCERARDADAVRARRSAAPCPAASAWRSAPPCRAGCASSKRSSAPATTSSAAARCCSALDWPLLLLKSGMTPTQHDARRVLPAEGRGERLELLLLVPVPAAGAPARDHRALRVLPRGRRRGRRDAAIRSSRPPSSPGGAPRSRNLFAGNPQHPVTKALRASHGAVRASRQEAPERDHRRHGDGPHADALPRLAGPRALLLPRRRRGRPARRGHLRLPRPAHARVRARRSASRSSSPTSSATSARTRARTASTCRWTTCKRFGVPAADILHGAAKRPSSAS